MAFVTLPFLLAAVLAAPAFAQLDAWRAFKEEELHSRSFANFDGPAAELFAPCDKQGALHLPKPYSADYDIKQPNHAAFETKLKAVKRYGDIREALKDGYLPVPHAFVQGVGMMLGHPDLIQDGGYRLERPDVLTYVKKQGAPRFRLVGLLYLAGKTPPKRVPNMDLKRNKKRGKQNAGGGWGPKDQLCVIVKPGHSVGLYERSETPNGCKDGALLSPVYGLYAWPLLYNPEGMFNPQNPLVDFIDRSQKFGPLCPKAGAH